MCRLQLQATLREQGSLILEVQVTPGATQPGIVGRLADDRIKIRVASPPEHGKANREVCRILAAWLCLPSRNLEVVLGSTSRKKRIRVLGSIPA